jgi:ATP-dependent Clp protease ATP-binding subunit ClpX
MMKKTSKACCSFCRKSYRDVGPLVEGPSDVYICGECVELCQHIVDQERLRRGVTPAGSGPIKSQSILTTLDKVVAGQEYAKAALAEAASFRHEGRGRVLLIGPSQSSAMFLAKAVAYALGVPFAAGETSGLRKAGNGNLLFDLLAASNFDIESTQNGVVFVSGAERPDAQDALISLWQENVSDPGHGLQLDVRKVLFVCGATFAGLDDAIVRLGRHPQQPVTVEALRAVGVRAEWAGALAAIARVPPLDEQSLARVVKCVDFRLL